MGKTRDLFKKTGDIKGRFHARMGMIKDRNSKDLTKQKILRRSGKNTQEKYINVVGREVGGGFMFGNICKN